MHYAFSVSAKLKAFAEQIITNLSSFPYETGRKQRGSILGKCIWRTSLFQGEQER